MKAETLVLLFVAILTPHIFPAEFDQGGHAYIKAAWNGEPKFETGPRVTKAELNAGLERFPRSQRRMEPWMYGLE